MFLKIDNQKKPMLINIDQIVRVEAVGDGRGIHIWSTQNNAFFLPMTLEEFEVIADDYTNERRDEPVHDDGAKPSVSRGRRKSTEDSYNSSTAG